MLSWSQWCFLVLHAAPPPLVPNPACGARIWHERKLATSLFPNTVTIAVDMDIATSSPQGICLKTDEKKSATNSVSECTFMANAYRLFRRCLLFNWQLPFWNPGRCKLDSPMYFSPKKLLIAFFKIRREISPGGLEIGWEMGRSGNADKWGVAATGPLLSQLPISFLELAQNKLLIWTPHQN